MQDLAEVNDQDKDIRFLQELKDAGLSRLHVSNMNESFWDEVFQEITGNVFSNT